MNMEEIKKYEDKISRRDFQIRLLKEQFKNMNELICEVAEKDLEIIKLKETIDKLKKNPTVYIRINK